MKIVQVKLTAKGSQGLEVLTTWVENHVDLEVGKFIALKDFKPEQKWLVTEIYSSVHDASEFDWHRKWDNNI